jgi:uncharacterized protein YegP (UPF0339 family)
VLISMASYQGESCKTGMHSFRSSNGQIIAVSGEGYIRRGDCEHAINLVKQRAASAPVQALAY